MALPPTNRKRDAIASGDSSASLSCRAKSTDAALGVRRHVDFHHAAAVTYEQVLDHLEPQHLIGLTATPEHSAEEGRRTDPSRVASIELIG